MKSSRLRLAPLTILAACAWQLSARAQQPAATAPAPAHDQEIPYVRHGCYQCHGFAGQGSILSGPALAGRALDANTIVQYTRTPAGVMPAYGRSVLSDAELAAIATYVRSMPGGAPIESIEALSRFARKRPPRPRP